MARTNYFKNLDGLRFIAAFAVICSHFTMDFKIEGEYSESIVRILSFNGGGGSLAVKFFFILSGFLITYLLIEEKQDTQTINLKNFFARRILRIWPLYFLIIIFGFYLSPLFSSVFGSNHLETANFFYYATFLANYDQIYNGSPTSPIIELLWSLSVEEQFYLIWPFLLLWFTIKNKYLIHFFILTVFVAVLFIYFNLHDPLTLQIHTISSFMELGTGAILAYIVYNYSGAIKSTLGLFKNTASYSFILYIVGVCFLFYFTGMDKADHVAIVYMIFSCVFFSFIILDQTLNTYTKFQFGTNNLISYFGKISFGMYMYHTIPIALLKFLSNKIPIHGITIYFLFFLEVLITIVLSHFSYKYFEMYFIKLKNGYYSDNSNNFIVSK